MKKILIAILICIPMVGVFFLGKQFGTTENTVLSTTENTTPTAEITAGEDTAQQNLNLSFDHNLDSYFYIPLEQGNYTSVSGYGMDNIAIEIDGVPMDLEKALTEGHISVDEIVALARADDRQGTCNEVAESENGVTNFIYYYNNFRLRHVYDIYETPDGSNHLIASISFWSIGHEPAFNPSFCDGFGKRVDYEDWGLEFTGSKTDQKSITVTYSQSGGQQFGELKVENFALYNAYDANPVLLPDGEIWTELSDAVVLRRDGESEFTLDLESIYGSVPAGDYRLELRITDVYDPETVHPLTQNFYDTQYYSIKITVPAQIYDFS